MLREVEQGETGETSVLREVKNVSVGETGVLGEAEHVLAGDTGGWRSKREAVKLWLL